MSRVGFIGLGLMGSRMARRMLQAGHQLGVWDPDPKRVGALVAAGATAAADPVSAVADREFVVTMVPDPESLDGLIFGAGGLDGLLSPGQMLVDMSTVGPHYIVGLRARLMPAVSLVDAPVRGSLPEAERGQLVVMVGASDGDFARVRPLLRCLGEVERVGELGAGAAMKLAVNLSLGCALTSLGESLALADALGVGRERALSLLADCPWAPLLKSRRTMVESGEYPPQLRLGLAAKDFRLIREAAARSGTNLPVAEAAASWLETAVAALGEAPDFAAALTLIRDQSRRGG